MAPSVQRDRPGTEHRWQRAHRRIAGWRLALERELAVLTAPVTRAANDRRYLATLVVLSLALFALAARLRLLHGFPAGDEPAYLLMSQTLQKYHSFNVMLDYEHRDYWSLYPAELSPHVVAAPDGSLQPLHGFGGPLLWFVPFILWGRAGAVGFMVVVSALVVANVYRFLRERRIEPNYAFFTTLLLALGSPIYVYASMSYVEPIGALIVIYATRVLLAHRPHPVRVLVAAIGLGFAPWVHVRLVTFSLTLGTLLLARLWLDRGRPRVAVLACCLGPLLVGAFVLEYYTWHIWHSVNPGAGMSSFGNGPFQIPLHTGLAGTFFDRQYGLVTNFPLFLLVLPGILLTLRRPYWLLHTVLFLTIAPYLVLICTFWSWYGGYCPPARFVSVFTPLLAFPIAVTLQRLRSIALNVAAALLAAIGYALSFITDVHPNDRFQGAGAHNLAMERIGAAVDWRFYDYVPSSFLPYQAESFWTWTVITIGIGVALFLAARPWSTGSRSGEAEPEPVPDRDQDQDPLLIGV